MLAIGMFMHLGAGHVVCMSFIPAGESRDCSSHSSHGFFFLAVVDGRLVVFQNVVGECGLDRVWFDVCGSGLGP